MAVIIELPNPTIFIVSSTIVATSVFELVYVKTLLLFVVGGTIANSPSPRKDGQLVTDTFIKLFGNNPEYQLTLKCHGASTVRIYNDRKELVSPDTVYSNIKIIKIPRIPCCCFWIVHGGSIICKWEVNI